MDAESSCCQTTYWVRKKVLMNIFYLTFFSLYYDVIQQNNIVIDILVLVRA